MPLPPAIVSLPVFEPVIVWLLAPAVMLKLDVEAWAVNVWPLVFSPVTVTVSLASPPFTTRLPLPATRDAALSVTLE